MLNPSVAYRHCMCPGPSSVILLVSGSRAVLRLCRYLWSRKEFHTALELTSLCRGKLYMGWNIFRRHTGWGCQVRGSLDP